MATLTKARVAAAIEIAEGSVSTGWSNFRGQGEQFNIGIGRYRLNMPRHEAEALVASLRQQLDDPSLKATAGAVS